LTAYPLLAQYSLNHNESTVESLAAQAMQIKGMLSGDDPTTTQHARSLWLVSSSNSTEAQNAVMTMIEHSDPATVGQALHSLLQ